MAPHSSSEDPADHPAGRTGHRRTAERSGVPRTNFLEFDPSTTAVLSREQRASLCFRKGICVGCGRQTHRVTPFKRTALTNSEVKDGKCQICFPEKKKKSKKQMIAAERNRKAALAVRMAVRISSNAKDAAGAGNGPITESPTGVDADISGGALSNPPRPSRPVAAEKVSGKSTRKVESMRKRDRALLAVRGAVRLHRSAARSRRVAAHKDYASLSDSDSAATSNAVAKGDPELDGAKELRQNTNSEKGSGSTRNQALLAGQDTARMQSGSSRASSPNSLSSDTSCDNNEGKSPNTLAAGEPSLPPSAQRDVPDEDTGEETDAAARGSTRETWKGIDLGDGSGADKICSQSERSASRNTQVHDLDVDNDSISGLTDDDSIWAVAEAMCSKPQTLHLLQQKCSVLRNIQDNRGSALRRIVDAMNRHPGDASLQEKACGAIWVIASLNDEAKAEAADAGAIDAVLRALDSGAIENPSLVCWCCGTLSSLTHGNKNQMKIVGVIGALLPALNKHATSSEVLEWVCRALYSLVQRENEEEKEENDDIEMNDEVKTIIRKILESGIIAGILCAISNSANEWTAQEWAFRLFSSLSNEEAFSIQFQADGGLDICEHIIQESPTTPILQELVCSVLSGVIEHGGSQIAGPSISEYICPTINAMIVYSNNVDIQESALGLLSSLARLSDTNKTLIHQCGGLWTILDVMEKNVNHTTIQEISSWILWSVSSFVSSFDSSIISAVFSAIINTIKHHSQNVYLQVASCGVLANFSLFAGEDAEQVDLNCIFEVLGTYPDEPLLQEQGCRVIQNFACKGCIDVLSFAPDGMHAILRALRVPSAQGAAVGALYAVLSADNKNGSVLLSDEDVDALATAMDKNADDESIQMMALYTLASISGGPESDIPVLSNAVIEIVDRTMAKFPDNDDILGWGSLALEEYMRQELSVSSQESKDLITEQESHALCDLPELPSLEFEPSSFDVDSPFERADFISLRPSFTDDCKQWQDEPHGQNMHTQTCSTENGSSPPQASARSLLKITAEELDEGDANDDSDDGRSVQSDIAVVTKRCASPLDISSPNRAIAEADIPAPAEDANGKFLPRVVVARENSQKSIQRCASSSEDMSVEGDMNTNITTKTENNPPGEKACRTKQSLSASEVIDAIPTSDSLVEKLDSHRGLQHLELQIEVLGGLYEILSFSGYAHVHFLDGDGIDVIISIMVTALAEHPSRKSAALFEIGFNILLLLSAFPGSHDAFVKNLRLPHVIDLMIETDVLPETQEKGCAVLANASKENIAMQLLILESDGVHAVINAMTCHPNDGCVLKSACKALSLLGVDAESREFIAERGGVLLLLVAILSFPNDLELHREALVALDGLVADVSKSYLSASNVHHAVIHAMCTHPEEKIQHIGLDIINNLCRRHVLSAAMIEEVGGVEVVLRAAGTCTTPHIAECVMAALRRTVAPQTQSTHFLEAPTKSISFQNVTMNSAMPEPGELPRRHSS